jgi:hypothetical protein
MAVHGKDSVFSVEDSAGSTLRDLSSQLTNVAFSRQNDTHDETAFGDDGHEFIAGLTNGTITLTGWADTTATTGSLTVLDSLLGLGSTKVDWEYGPMGSGSGAVKYTGAAVLASLDVSDPVADLISFTATLQISGTVTKGTYSA